MSRLSSKFSKPSRLEQSRKGVNSIVSTTLAVGCEQFGFVDDLVQVLKLLQQEKELENCNCSGKIVLAIVDRCVGRPVC
jgi:hypothetical protein